MPSYVLDYPYPHYPHPHYVDRWVAAAVAVGPPLSIVLALDLPHSSPPSPWSRRVSATRLVLCQSAHLMETH